MPLDEPDPVAQALAANHFGAHAYLGFQSHPDPIATAYYYKVPTFESVGGRALAEALVNELAAVAAIEHLAPMACGMRLPVLRETRMPAVLLTIGPARLATDATAQLTSAVLRALDLWILRTG